MRRPLVCACCGASAGRWQQHYNRDTGFGICVRCVAWIRQRMVERPHLYGPEDSIESLYGVEGVNWGPDHA